MHLSENYLVDTDQTYSKVYISDQALRLNFEANDWKLEISYKATIFR